MFIRSEFLFFAYTCVVRNMRHAPNARWLAYRGLHIWHEICGDTRLLGHPPSSGSHKQSTRFPSEFEWSTVFFWGDKT